MIEMTGAIYPWVNFVLFAGLLFYFLRGPVRDFLGDRRERLRREIEEVSKAKLDISFRHKEYRKKIAQADQEVEDLKRELRLTGEIERKNIIRRAEAMAAKLRGDAAKMGEREREKARWGLKKEALAQAVHLARKEITERLKAEDHERLIEWGIQKLNGTKHEGIHTR